MADNKKVKYFNKMYKEFQTNLLKSLKKANEKVYSVKRIEQINEFDKQITENLDLLKEKNELLFEKVSLLKRIFFGKPKLNQINSIIAWKYINIFYTISSGTSVITSSSEKPEDELMKSFGLSSSQMSGVVNELVNGKNEGLQNLVKDLSSQFSSIKKDIQPKEIIEAIMNPGKENSMGIDFKQIIENTSKKITSGEIDISSIKEAISKN